MARWLGLASATRLAEHEAPRVAAFRQNTPTPTSSATGPRDELGAFVGRKVELASPPGRLSVTGLYAAPSFHEIVSRPSGASATRVPNRALSRSSVRRSQSTSSREARESWSLRI